MCGLLGFVDLTKDTSNLKNTAFLMNDELSKRGPDEEGFYFEDNICLAHKRLIVVDSEKRKTANEC